MPKHWREECETTGPKKVKRPTKKRFIIEERFDIEAAKESGRYTGQDWMSRLLRRDGSWHVYKKYRTASARDNALADLKKKAVSEGFWWLSRRFYVYRAVDL